MEANTSWVAKGDSKQQNEFAAWWILKSHYHIIRSYQAGCEYLANVGDKQLKSSGQDWQHQQKHSVIESSSAKSVPIMLKKQ